MKQIFRSLGQS